MIRLTNTRTRAKEEWKPPRKNISMYVCGITPYDHAHLGHLLSAVRFDVIRRFLTHRGYKVTFVENVTDVDDKIIARAEERKQLPVDLVEPFMAEYEEFKREYHLLPPDKNPRVSQYIPEIVKYIEELVKNGAAYVSWGGNVYFGVEGHKGYGALSGASPREMESTGRVAKEDDKRDTRDFALWKRDEAPGASWTSPWGRGRPGWHIECSVMANTLLGNPIDIHGGGMDLLFPHHENESAQAEAKNKAPYVNVWLHSGLLMVEGAKMSKSLQNFITIPEAHERFGVALLKFSMLRFHYRSPMAFSDRLLQENINTVRAFAELFRMSAATEYTPTELTKQFDEMMDDDFNTPKALVVLQDAVDRAYTLHEAQHGNDFRPLVAEIRALCGVLGLFAGSVTETIEELLAFHARVTGKAPADLSKIEKLLIERDGARAKKDFKTSDRVRDELSLAGLKVLDTPRGSKWQFDIGN